MIRTLTVTLLWLFSLTTQGAEQQIRYHLPFGKEVYMVWGVDGWQKVATLPPGTILKDGIMYSPMQQRGEDFSITVSVPDDATLDFVFWITKGPWAVDINYWDVNYKADKPNEKNYHCKVGQNTSVLINPDLSYIKPAKAITIFSFARYLLYFFLAGFLLLLAIQKIIRKKPRGSLNPYRLILSTMLVLLLFHIPIRASAAGLVWPFITDPLATSGLLVKAVYYDFLYIIFLGLFFSALVYISRNWPRIQKTLLYFYLGWSFVSLLAGLLNIKVVEQLGRPFNYQWLYYSDFLNSTDARNALNANVDSSFIYDLLFVLLAMLPAMWIMYHLCAGLAKRIHLKKVLSGSVLALALFIFIGSGANKNPVLLRGKLENPVVSFLSSVNPFSSSESLFSSTAKSSSEFENKNPQVLKPAYSKLFKDGKIKNVLIFVLESTPAEYVQCYNPAIGATPFLNSCSREAAVFTNIYAHAPATNNSMVSILCSLYPKLSYKSITAEKPNLAQPSIPSELKKNGYRSAFFNSGDNRFQRADEFLRNRSFDEVQDFRDNSCGAKQFLAENKEWVNLDGIDDRCLADKCLSWIRKTKDKPFFAMMWTFQTHYPYYASGQETDYHVKDGNLNRYLNALRTADQTLQEIVEGLKKESLYESTLIVVLGDHGEAFGRHDQTTHASKIYEENLHIPLLLINPLFKGERIDDLGGISDIAPSIFGVLNKPVPEGWQGESLFNSTRRQRVYFFAPWSDYWFGYREGHYKYLFNASTDTREVYDLRKDPLEAENIADQMPELTEKGQKNLASWVQYQNAYMKKLFGNN